MRLSLSLFLFSVRLQISFLCRLIKLAWHISDFYHLISPPSVHLSPSFFPFLRYFFRRLYTSILSISLFLPSHSPFLCVFTYRYVSVFVHVHLRCYATVLVHGATSIPFGTFLDPRRGYFTLPRGLGMNSNSFRVLVSLCSRCFEEEDRFFPWRTR